MTTSERPAGPEEPYLSGVEGTPPRGSGAAVFLLLLLTFLAGGVGGILVQRRILQEKSEPLWLRAGASWNADQFLGFSRDLELDSVQQEKLRDILSNAHPRFQSLFNDVRPRYGSLVDEVRGEIRKILSTDQAERFDRMCRTVDDRINQYYIEEQ